MAQQRPSNHRETVRELVQRQRNELYAAGHQNVNMALPQQVIDHIDLLKKRYNLRSRNEVVARVIARSRAAFSPDTFASRAALRAVDKNTFRRISPIVPNELADYMQQIQQRFRGVAYGPVFEMIFAEVGDDLSTPAVQLELIQRERAVSG